MSDHVLHLLADHLEGRLDRGESQSVLAHLEECRACRDELGWAEEFHAEIDRLRLRHMESDRIIAVAEDEFQLTASETEHLQHCSMCAGDLDWARTQRSDVEILADVNSERAEGETAPSGRAKGRQGNGWFRWFLVAVPVTVAALALIVVLERGGSGDPKLSSIAVVEPVSVRINRGDVESGSFEEARLRGLEHYVAGGYGAALEEFSRATTLDPEDEEVRLLLGSTELLTGRVEDAGESFLAVREMTDSIQLVEESCWQLAQVFLLLDRESEAVESLERVVAIEGRRATVAAECLTAIRSN